MNEEYTWEYHYSLFKNHDWIYTYLILLGIIILFIEFTLFLVDPGDFFNTFINNLWVIGLILFLFSISVVIAFIWFRKGYLYVYHLKENGIKVEQPLVYTNHVMFVNQRIASSIYFENIQSIKMNKKADIIKIRGFLIKTNLYANKDEIDFIYKMIKERCDHLKGDL